MTPNPKRPLTLTQLSAVTGFGRTYIGAAKLAGFVFTHGLRTTEQSLLDWVAAHPDFREGQYYKRRSRAAIERHPLRKGAKLPRQEHPVATVSPAPSSRAIDAA